ncbi:MAG: hypothetical protein DHS20C05_06990 [Hyphococcus sp.]|nr:MAG: hypothetical protein DHS20C05_06990 [Marinicaulis sp.]
MSEKKQNTISLNFETIGSVVAMLIGAIALFVAWDQAQVMRKQQHASVWPIISADLLVSGDVETRFIEFAIMNAGVGPALVESVSLMSDGEALARWSDLETVLFGTPPSGPMGFNGNDIEGAVIAAGQTVSVLKGSWGASEEIDNAFMILAERYVKGNAPNVYLSVCYCSVFERCWRSTDQSRAEPVRSCSAPTGYFENLFIEDQANPS